MTYRELLEREIQVAWTNYSTKGAWDHDWREGFAAGLERALAVLDYTELVAVENDQ